MCDAMYAIVQCNVRNCAMQCMRWCIRRNVYWCKVIWNYKVAQTSRNGHRTKTEIQFSAYPGCFEHSQFLLGFKLHSSSRALFLSYLARRPLYFQRPGHPSVISSLRFTHLDVRVHISGLSRWRLPVGLFTVLYCSMVRYTAINRMKSESNRILRSTQTRWRGIVYGHNIVGYVYTER